MGIISTEEAKRIIERGASASIPFGTIINHEIQVTQASKEWRWMCKGDDYYLGRHDILQKKRTAIGEGGKLVQVNNLPNNRQIDNVYKRMVQQKTNYLFGKPFTVQSDNATYQNLLTQIFDKQFMKLLKNVAKDSLNCGLGWLYLYYGEDGTLQFERMKPYELIPLWNDSEHTSLEGAIRFYDIINYNGQTEQRIRKVEYYTLNGIDYYQYYNGSLLIAPPYHTDYITAADGKTYNWDRIPLIPFKYNDEEIPLIVNCKSLQDGLNQLISAFSDNMEEDTRNTILILKNYDGENLGEFRRNLATYGAVKVRTIDGADGGVDALQIDVNSENYKTIIQMLKKAIVENCMGYDVKDEAIGGTPNQMNIQSMYNDIDLDASDMETEYQAAMDNLLDFVDIYLKNAGLGDFTREQVEITFNTNMPMDESTTIQNIQNSVGILSTETLVAHHPWVTDADAEIEKLDAEKQKNMEDYGLAFQKNPSGDGNGEGDDPQDGDE